MVGVAAMVAVAGTEVAEGMHTVGVAVGGVGRSGGGKNGSGGSGSGSKRKSVSPTLTTRG